MKKVVIAGSAKLQNEINKWINYFETRNYEVIDYPKEIEVSRFTELYPDIHTEFLQNVTKTDILFIMNENKNNIEGYIGYEAYAELLFGLSQKLIYNKKIELIIYKKPSKKVGCYDEINLWLELGWIKLFKEENDGNKRTN